MWCRYELTQADLAVSSFTDLSVINLRRLFAARGAEFMDLQKQFEDPEPRKRKIRNDTMFWKTCVATRVILQTPCVLIEEEEVYLYKGQKEYCCNLDVLWQIGVFLKTYNKTLDCGKCLGCKCFHSIRALMHELGQKMRIMGRDE